MTAFQLTILIILIQSDNSCNEKPQFFIRNTYFRFGVKAPFRTSLNHDYIKRGVKEFNYLLEQEPWKLGGRRDCEAAATGSVGETSKGI